MRYANKTPGTISSMVTSHHGAQNKKCLTEFCQALNNHGVEAMLILLLPTL